VYSISPQPRYAGCVRSMKKQNGISVLTYPYSMLGAAGDGPREML